MPFMIQTDSEMHPPPGPRAMFGILEGVPCYPGHELATSNWAQQVELNKSI